MTMNKAFFIYQFFVGILWKFGVSVVLVLILMAGFPMPKS